jgi:hypothetical protein
MKKTKGRKSRVTVTLSEGVLEQIVLFVFTVTSIKENDRQLKGTGKNYGFTIALQIIDRAGAISYTVQYSVQCTSIPRAVPFSGSNSVILKYKNYRHSTEQIIQI